MSILNMLNRTTLGIGVKAPESYTKKAQRRGLKSGQDLTSAAEQGYSFRDPSLGTTKYTDTPPEMVNNSNLKGTAKNYQESMFNSMLARTNKLTDPKQKSYIRSTTIGTDDVTYTQKIFQQQLTAAGNYQSVPTSLIQAGGPNKLVLTPVSSTIGTGPGEPFDDGRYIPTFGYGFVEYGTLANGGYSG